MKILLTNDDGIYAQGLYAVYQELKRIGQVTVVAPDSERSSVGHGITLAHPILVKKINRKGRFFGYGISGTPADCVKFGISVILKKKPDVIISGINQGPNDGCSVFYSGTVAGAREGAILGVPSIAASLGTFIKQDFSAAAKFIAKLAKALPDFKLPRQTFLSVNIPAQKLRDIKGVKITRQGLEPIHGIFQKRHDPNFRSYYWVTGKAPAFKNDMTVDTYTLSKNYITITPIHCDLTDEDVFEQLSLLNLSTIFPLNK